jgi:Outer membrane protein beta-barrel domain
MRKTSLLLPIALIVAAPLAASAQDASAWAGAYAGAQLSYGDGFQDYGGGNTFDIYGESYGLFAGYMWTSGAWAYGAELAYANASFHEYDGRTSFPSFSSTTRST